MKEQLDLVLMTERGEADRSWHLCSSWEKGRNWAESARVGEVWRELLRRESREERLRVELLGSAVRGRGGRSA